jgi:hypothetical protein
MQKSSPNSEMDMFSFLGPHRVLLDARLGDLSAGLSAKLFFAPSSGSLATIPDLITFTSAHYTMGGAWRWRATEFIYSDQTGSKIPVFSLYRKISAQDLYPIQNSPQIALSNNKGFPAAVRETRDGDYRIDESLSEQLATPLFELGVGGLSPCRIEFRTFFGRSLPDVVIGTNSWEEYYPRDDNGKITRWGQANYRPFDAQGHWRGGKLHGNVYFARNRGENPQEPESYQYDAPVKCDIVDQYGHCTPAFGDFCHTGTDDMICGDFLDNLTYFRCIGQDQNELPKFASGLPLLRRDGSLLLCGGVINYVCSIDLNQNGWPDLLVGSENGYVTYFENLGQYSPNGGPLFADPIRIQQTNPPLKADVLNVPACWQHLADEFIMISGTARGNFYEFRADASFQKIYSYGVRNDLPRVIPPTPEGSIQGPSEVGWGYTCPVWFDFRGIGLKDYCFSDINGLHTVYLNIGTPHHPLFDQPVPILDVHTDKPLQTVWRVRPAVLRMASGEIRYFCLDPDAIFTEYQLTIEIQDTRLPRIYAKRLGPVQTQFNERFTFVQTFGGSRGRVKLAIADWYGPNSNDFLIGTPANHSFHHLRGNENQPGFSHATVAIMRNIGTKDQIILSPPKYLIHRQLGGPIDFGHHSCSPECTTAPEGLKLLVGCEDGQIYAFSRSEFGEN